MTKKKGTDPRSSDPPERQIRENDAGEVIIPGYTALRDGMIRLVMSEDDYQWLVRAVAAGIERMIDDEPDEALSILGALCAATRGDPARAAYERSLSAIHGRILVNIAKRVGREVRAEAGRK